MRISDWSSDVCSSDLAIGHQREFERVFGRLAHAFFARKTLHIPKVGPAPGARTLDAIAVITDHIGPKHRPAAAVLHRRGQDGVASDHCRPVWPMATTLFPPKVPLHGKMATLRDGKK